MTLCTPAAVLAAVVADDGSVSSMPPASGAATPSPPPPASPARRRGRFSVRDVTLSLGVLIVPIFAVIVLFQALGADPVRRVDAEPAYTQAEGGGGFPVLRAQGLRDGWVVTAASTTRADGAVTLRVGLVAPSGRFARLAESGRSVEQVLAAELGGTPRATGAEEIGGQVWLRYPGRGNEQALVSVRPKVVLVVTGTAEPSELREIAASLR
jgi:hypothetical protein